MPERFHDGLQFLNGERVLSSKNLLQRRRLLTRGAHPKTLGTFFLSFRRKMQLSIHCHAGPRGACEDGGVESVGCMMSQRASSNLQHRRRHIQPTQELKNQVKAQPFSRRHQRRRRSRQSKVCKNNTCRIPWASTKEKPNLASVQ